MSNIEEETDLSVFETGIESLFINDSDYTDNTAYTTAAEDIETLWNDFMAEADNLESVLKGERGDVLLNLLQGIKAKNLGAGLVAYVKTMTTDMDAYIEAIDTADKDLYKS